MAETTVPAKRRLPLVMMTISLYILMFAYAFSVTMIGPLISVFMNEYHVSYSQSGLISLFQGLGGAVCVFLGIAFADRVRRSLLLKTCFIVYCAAAFAIAVAPPYVVLLILFFLIGGSTRLLDAVLNAYIADLHPGKRSFYLTLLHAAFGVGALLGPLVSTAFIHANIHWTYVFLALGGFCVLILVFYTLVQRKMPLAKPEGKMTGLKNLGRLLKSKDIRLLSFIALSYVAFALSCSTWMPSYMNKQLHQEVVFSSLPVISMWAGIIAGRITCSFLSLKFPAKYLLLIGGLVGGAAMAAAVMINSPIVYVIALAVAGFALGAVMPLAIAVGNNMLPAFSGSVSSLLTFSGIIGLMLFPWLIGVIADWVGLWYGIAMIVLFPCATAILSAFLSRPQRMLPN